MLTDGFSEGGPVGSEWWTLEQTKKSHLINQTTNNLEIIIYSQGTVQAIFSAIAGFGSAFI